MHNRKKSGILLAFILLVFIGYHFLRGNGPQKIIEKTVIEKIEKKEKKETHKKTVQQIVREQHLIKADKSAAQVQVIERVYDEDPVVDASLIMENNRLCISYLSYNKNKTKEYFKRFENILNAKQIKYYQNFYEYCQTLNEQHPEYHLDDINALHNQKKQAKANSLWGKIIKGEIDVNSLNETEIAGLLKQNNLNILKQAPKYLSDYYDKIIHWDIEDVLNNHQYNYVQLTQQYAHQLYLCQLGSECGPHSSIMAALCYLNDKSCGLDFPQFVQQALTQGQQADIQLSMDYLKNIYQ